MFARVKVAVVAVMVLALGAGSSLASRPAPAAAAPPAVPMLGTAWYPEQWPEARWDTDLALMQRAGITFVRVGEFAWSALEPAEGDFRLDWLERAVRAAERHGIRVVIGTPTAGPPAWLTSRYPDVLRTAADGRRATHGGRHQASFTSDRYAGLAATIVARLADRFGHDPNVIGWQLDNEIGTGDFGDTTRAKFHAWLTARYGTLDALNTAWATRYWSQTYSDWSQVPLPLPGADANPGLMLAFRAFGTAAYHDYLANQLTALEARVDPRQKVTTNYWIDARAKTPADFSAESDDLDLAEVSRDLDVAGWDEYVGSGHLDPDRFGLVHDTVRGLLQRNFWVLETQPGTVNWSVNNNALAPGEMRALAWHAIGHGADALAYWQWRTALGGQEQYHGTLVGVDGQPVPAYHEVATIGAEFARAAPALAGTTVVAEVALLNDWPSRWALGWQRFAREFLPGEVAAAYYIPLKRYARSVDVVAPSRPLDRYRLVVAPSLNVLTAEVAARLTTYVRNGGHLIVGPRTGMKDVNNALWPERQPGPLAALLGARVEQWYALEAAVPVSGTAGSGQASVWGERLDATAPGAAVILRYGKANGWLDGQAAAITRQVGRGSITYVGALLDSALMAQIIGDRARAAGVAAPWPDLAKEIDVGIRSDGRHRVTVLTNFGQSAQTIVPPRPMRDVLTGARVTDVRLPAYGVAVLAD